ncbi:MAG TPA: SRPBCC family protein [Mycobacteriales bacterium]
MSVISRHRTIHASPEAVWGVLADFASISTWADNVDHSCLLHTGEPGVGMTRRIQAGRTTVVERIVTWEPLATLAYDLEGLPPVVRSARNRWDLTPESGATRVTLTSTVDAGPRPPQQLVARVVGRVLARQSDVMLAGLAAATSHDSAAATEGSARV